MTVTASHPVTTWQGCYDGSWRGLIVPEAYAHPAKFSRGLIERIIRCGLAEGWWRPADLIGDPFGGVALGGIIAGYAGLNWIGVELEPRFVELGDKNLALHRPKWVALGGGFPHVKLIQGDSRRFADLVRASASPPYADSVNQDRSGIDYSKLKAIDYPGRKLHAARVEYHEKKFAELKYGATDGQIGALKDGDVDAVITSPPYADGGQGGGGDFHPDPTRHGDNSNGGSLRHGYGQTPGQLGNLPTGAIDGVITSPPYADRCVNDNQRTLARDGLRSGFNEGEAGTYGATEGQIGELQPGALDGVVTSPPFRDARSDTTRPIPPPSMNGELAKADGRLHRIGQCDYGDDPANIGDLRTGIVDGVVTSPPYEGSEVASACKSQNANGRQATYKRAMGHNGYAEQTEGSIGVESGETYWQAMSVVYGQCLAALRPGGDAAPDGDGIVFCACDKCCAVNYDDEHGISRGVHGRRGVPAEQGPRLPDHLGTKQPCGASGNNGMARGEGDNGAAIQDTRSPAPTTESDLYASRQPASGLQDAVRDADASPHRKTAGLRSNAPMDQVAAATEELRAGRSRTLSQTSSSTDDRRRDRKTIENRKVSRLENSEAFGSDIPVGRSGDARYQATEPDASGSESGEVGEREEREVPRLQGSDLEVQREALQVVRPTSQTQIIKNVRYQVCQSCEKPVSGSGRTLGGILCVVVKNYVKGGQVVPLCDQTLRLLMHLGFEPVERIHAMLVREHVDHCMFSGPRVVRKERKSFFRRLAEKKGSPRIDWEEVLVVRKAGVA